MKTDKFIKLGDELIEIVNGATRIVIIVAPFIKVNALQRILECVPNTVEVRCVTRWRLEEICVGVSDIDIWPIIKQRGNTSLQLYADLHAKYYRADDVCYVGSANVTLKALTWARNSNLELMVKLPADHDPFPSFEKRLLELAVDVDDSIYYNMKENVEIMQQENAMLNVDDAPLAEDIDFNQQTCFWIPQLRHPEDLFAIYIDEVDHIIDSTIVIGKEDLYSLDIPRGLNKKQFTTYIGSALLQQPILKSIDGFLTESQRFGAMTGFLRTIFEREGIVEDTTRVWQNLMRWLLFYLPNRYGVKVPRHSEVFYRIK